MLDLSRLSARGNLWHEHYANATGNEIRHQFFLCNLRQFVDGFNEDDVISHAVLRDLSIKETLVDIVCLPMDLAEGRIGLLDISIKPNVTEEGRILVTMTHVHLLLRPLPPPWNIAREYELRTHSAKLLRLQLSELFDAILLQGDISRSFFDFARRVRFALNDVHVRHEGTGSCTMGVAVDSLVYDDVEDSEGLSQLMTAVTKTIHLTNVCIYARDPENPVTLPRWSNKSNEPFSMPPSPSDSLLLEPFSALITCNLSSIASGPLLDLQFCLPKIKATLTDAQYKCIHDSVQDIQAWKCQWKFRPFRPPPEVFVNNLAKARLRYAFDATLHAIRERRRTRSWSHLKQRRDNRRLYIDLFLRHRNAPLPQQEEQQLQALERKLPLSDLRLYRLVARRSTRAFTHLVSLDSSLDSTSGRLHESKNNQGFSSPALAGGTELVRLDVQIPQGSISLQVISTSGRREILRVAFGALSITLNQTLHGRFTTTGSLRNLSAHTNLQALVFVKEPVDGGESCGEPFLKWAYDTESGRMKLRVMHTEVIYDKELVDAMLRFFQIPPEQLQSVEAFLTLAMQAIEANEQ
ncbi:hypothetical protein PC9H_005070 [Pleurotus ostreatus]|uniref:Chorein N-terminal domain-containing protein n=1 Tax=Pleurotus ostreatus TaxID=5322 RepID=A0A8H6ZVU4_PLEOS|nr:uncharacterized protein PC9H_005070 [Pleurotus ostreatus]KAF7433122.1 hypothetical protein PC9H_005070 [Pleurotus ostreatus]